MTCYIGFRYQLRKLQKERDKLLSEHKKKIGEAEKSGMNPIEFKVLKHSKPGELIIQDELIATQITNYLVSCAQCYFLPVPPRDEEGIWEQCEATSGEYVLTSAGIAKLHPLVKAEQRQNVLLFCNVIAVLTGLGGVTIGIISILK